MGVDGGVLAFDENRVREVVVPALRAGADHPVVRRALDRIHATALHPLHRDCRFDGLARIASHYDDEFSGCDLRFNYGVVDGRIVEQPSRWEAHGSDWGHNELAILFERVMVREAVSTYAHLGRRAVFASSMFPDGWLPEPPEPSPDDVTLAALIRRLDIGWYQTYDDGGQSVGFTGCLDAVSTSYLADQLPADSAEVSARFDPVDWPLFRRFRAVVNWAVENEHGLLWGQNLDLYWRDGARHYWFDDELPAAALT
jgi:hypothetical protein